MNTKTSGFFGDVQYCSPVESSVFYDVVSSCRVHRVPESMMTTADSEVFFMEKNASIYSLVAELRRNDAESEEKNKIPFTVLDAIPTFLVSPNCQRIAPSGEDNMCFINIETPSAIDAYPSVSSNSITAHFFSLSFREIDRMWQSLVSYLLGGSVSEGSMQYNLPRVDTYLRARSPYGAFMFSLWAVGVASILHHFHSIPIERVQQNLNKVNISLTLSQGGLGEGVGDDVHLFFENKLRLCVNRVSKMESTTNTVPSANTVSTISAVNREDWIEKVAERVVTIHEELCDTDEVQDDAESMIYPCILLIVPDLTTLRSDLEKSLCDSYTAVPILVASDPTKIHQLMSRSSGGRVPITLFSSKENIEEQLLMPEHERYLSRLKIKSIVFTGEEYYAHHYLLSSIVDGSPEIHWIKNSVNFFTESKKSSSVVDPFANIYIQESMNLILLLFRRFRLSKDEKILHPVLRLSTTFFVSKDSILFFRKTMSALKNAGLVCFEEEEDGSVAYRLEVLGRALSYRFRLPYENGFPELTVSDAKCILWCYALRQSRNTAFKFIYNSHVFPLWVNSSLDEFCLRHRLLLEKETIVNLESFLQELSCIPKLNESDSRIKTFLSYSSGRRQPISNHSGGLASTSSRGWFEQAPVQTSLDTTLKPHVDIFCYPPLGDLCEVCFGEHVLQCPMDLSYPLIVTHIVLHTTMWNNGVFLEYDKGFEPAPLLPIPSAVLQSPTFRSFLENVEDSAVGYWLDSCMEFRPQLSDPQELASLMAKTSSLLGLCEHGAFNRKRKNDNNPTTKHPKHETPESFKPESQAEAAAIEEFAKAALKLGRENAEKRFKGVKGFAFLNPSHENHAYYLSLLDRAT